MDQEKTLLKSNIIQGFGTLIVREFFLKLFSFIGQIFLARLLAPSEFGIYIIIVFIINLFSLFTDAGLSLAIIQKKEKPTQRELAEVFWLKTFLSLVLISLIWISAPFMKVFYPSFTDINIAMLKMFSVTLLLTSFRAIPISILERKIKYNLISLIDIIGLIIYYIVSLLCAFLNLGVWSFIIGAVSKEIIETIILFIIQPFIPQIVFGINSIKRMIKFGIYIQGNSLVNLLISSITPIIGGRYSGTFAVGLLDFAGSLVSIPNVISMNFARVAFAGYSRIQGEKELLSKSINKSVSILAIILYIFPVIFIGLGRDLIYCIYTEKWITAVPALYWFSISIFFYPTITSLGQVILSIGKSKELFWLTFTTAIIGGISALLFIKLFGFTGIAMANVIIYIGLYLSYIIILRKASYNFSAFYILIPNLIIAILSIIFTLILNIIIPSNIYNLIIKLMIISIMYLILNYIIAKQYTLELIKLTLDLIRSKN